MKKNPYKDAAANMMKMVGNQGINDGIAALRVAAKGGKQGVHNPSKSAPPGPKGENSKQPHEVGEQAKDESAEPGKAKTPEAAAADLIAKANPPGTEEEGFPEKDDDGDEAHPSSPVDRLFAKYGKGKAKRSIELNKRPMDHRRR